MTVKPFVSQVQDKPRSTNFIRQIIDSDLAANKNEGHVVTRFPPEPNGYLHIGHAKSICLNFGIAEDYGGVCYMRFDDTNPIKESSEYVESIKEDVKWLGWDWGEHLRHASDYFDQLYEYAVQLIGAGKAYVCSLSANEIRQYRGTLTEPGTNSPYRDRSVEENLDLFNRMRAGEFEDGAHVLRAKIDMASPNLNMRDPTVYRIRRMTHQNTGDKWCIYPMYDFTQCLSDSIEGVTHSLCTLEFEDHRPLYDWFLDNLDVPCHPQQIEFSRLSLEYTVMSKRMLNRLVEEDHVDGWNDPRMPTLVGLRRRGYTPQSIRDFCERIGITKSDNFIEMGVLENSVREDLDRTAPRAMAVLRPLRVVIDNYPEDQVEEFDAQNHPNDATQGSRKVPFSKVIYIERDDFMEDPPKKFFRLAPGREVRLRYAYFVTCERVVKDDRSGEIVEIHCRYDPETRGGSAPDGRKVKGTIHWVSADDAVQAEIRLYDRLFVTANPGAVQPGEEFTESLNPKSVEKLLAWVEPSLANAPAGARYQFERVGYFCVDTADVSAGRLVFNRTVTLRDTWAKLEKSAKGGGKVISQ
ncbi:MAG: glutamine--tRNA ligase/YqeY domain fusion protein [Gammaproteobacteria bacterium]|nr:glutamine--tRNA ligase/YqeY domain fusion protein [Gammaproteobacteria bacterium]